jgi:putative component of membrane protein insertase Oxa1/YidC/SpoIIIJ protein YidD
MKYFALAAIKFYQRFISPYKGYRCAYSAMTGCKSCSVLGFRAIRRFGVLQGVVLLKQRLQRCAVAYHRYRKPSLPVMRGPLSAQRGFGDCGACDLACTGADACALLDGCAECASIGDCGLLRSRRRRQDDEYVVIPVRGDKKRKP